MKILGALALLVVVAGCGSTTDSSGSSAGTPSNDLTAAHKLCTSTHEKALEGQKYADPAEFLVLGSDGKSIQVTSPEGGELPSTIALLDTECVMSELKAPSGLKPKLEATTAVMGRQTESWDKYEFSWSYNGASDGGQFEGVFELKD